MSYMLEQSHYLHLLNNLSQMCLFWLVLHPSFYAAPLSFNRAQITI